jgi:hypothetical protein
MKKAILLLLFIYSNGFGQTSNLVPSIIPPSPEAANFAKFAEIPINLSTGSYSQNIPIYEVKRGKISTSVALSYHGSGIKLEEMASWCGLGWALNAGGVVTRSVRGKPDDIGVNGFLQYSQGKTVQDIQELSGQARLNIYEDITNGCVDAEPDLFYVNANGMNFHFSFEWNNGGIKFSSDQKIKIEYSQDGAGKITEWRIIDGQGSIYKFNVIETTFETPNGSGTHCYSTQNFTSAWYLAEIRDINNENFIYFDYDNYSLKYEFKPSESYRQHIGGDTYCGNTSYYSFSSSLTVAGKRISQIRTDDDAIKIQFLPSTDDRTDNGNLVMVGTSNFKKLDKITVKDHNNNEIKSYKMDYDYSAGRLTLIKVKPQNNNTDASPPYELFYQSALPEMAPVLRSQDHWGYYNGAGNTTLIPPAGVLFNSNGFTANREPNVNFTLAGSLNKIKMPTGGIIELDLEAHDYGYIGGATLNEYETTPIMEQAYVDGTMANNQDLTITQSFTVHADLSGINTTTSVELHIRGHNNNGISMLINKKDSLNLISTLGKPSVRVINSTGGIAYPNHNIQGIDEDFTVTLNLPPDTYTLEAYCKFYDSQATQQDFAEITASFNDYTNVPLTKKPAGGVRVKEQRIYTNASDPNYQVIKYNYKMNSEPARSSGTINAAPFYNYIQNLFCLENQPNGGQTEHTGQYLVRTAQNMSAIGTIQDSHVIYREVEVIHQKGSANNGKTWHRFTSYYDVGDGFIFSLPICPITTQSYNRNLLQEQKEYRTGETTPFKTNNTNYTNEEKYVVGLRVDRLGGAYNATNFDDRFLNSGYATNFGHSKPIVTIEVMDNVSTTTNITYDSERQNVTQQSVQSSNNADNKIVTELYYPQNFSASYTQTTMVNNHFVGVPLETVTKRINTATNTSKIISAEYQEFDYTTKLRLQNVKKLNISNALSSGFQYAKDGSPDSRYVTEISYGNYDSKGNIREYTLRGNRKSSFLWGYKSQYPIAEIKEASFSEVTTALSAFGQTPTTISQEENAATLQGYMNQLRTNLPNAWVNSYTYNPLIGMASQTDPSQIAINFDYDTFKRLQNIRDRSNNIVKNYQYNYASTTPICVTPLPPTISLSSTTVCDAILTASGCGGTVNWSNGSVGSTITAYSKNTVTYSATCTVSGCTSGASNNLTFPTVPSGWVVNQIGSFTPADCVSESSGTWTIEGKGNTFGTSDNISFVNQSVSGNAIIVAKISTMSANLQGMRSGIMIRASNSPTADYFQFFFDSGFQVLSLYKQDNTTGDDPIGFQSATIPQWLRLKKNGNTISVWYSSMTNPNWNNDADWTQYGSNQTSITFNGSYLLGILAYNNAYNSNNTTNTTQFTNVSINTF